MKWRNIYFLTCITLFGEISYAIPLTRQKHFHKHYHVHIPEITPQGEVENNVVEHTKENIANENIAWKHRHDTTTEMKHGNRDENETIIEKEIKILKSKGFFKLPKGLRFKHKRNPDVRQHAAKSINL